MKFTAAFLLLTLTLTGCAAMKRHDISGQTGEIFISKRSRVSMDTVRQIADARGGKEDGEIWRIDRERGDVRIRKSWKDQPAKEAVAEIWHVDENGSWTER